MSYFGLSALYCSSVKYAAITAWATGVAKNVGDVVRNSAPNVENEYAFLCTVAGTTQASEPSWNASQPSKGQQYAETTGPTWIECTGQPALNGDIVNTPNWNTVKNSTVDRGFVIKDNAGTHLFMGTSSSGQAGNGAEPSWNTAAKGNTTTDNAVTWTYIGVPADFAAWQVPHARLRNMIRTAPGGPVNNYFVGHDHAETYSSTTAQMGSGATTPIRNVSINNAGPVAIYCVNTAGSVPPVTADLATTGSITVSASTLVVNFGNVKICYGMNFNMTTSASGLSMSIGQQDADQYFENCKFTFGSGMTGSAQFVVNNDGSQGAIRMKACTFKFNATTQSIAMTSRVTLEQCVLDTTTSTPSEPIRVETRGAAVQLIGMDLSAAWGSNLFRANYQGFSVDMIDCKLPTGALVPANWATNIFGNSGGRINFVRCDNGDDTFRMAAFDLNAFLTTSVTATRNGGANDGTTDYSWKVVTSVQAIAPSQAFRVPPLATFTASGSSKTGTIYGIANAAAIPTNAEVFADIHYLGSSASPIASIKSNRVGDYLTSTAPSNLSADTSDWDNGGTARANSHAYSLNDEIVLTSNAGRRFFCTTAGSSAASEPGGYATAIDGGSVTDGTAIFRAGWRFKIAITMTSPDPQIAGYAYGHLYIGRPTTTYYIDPLMEVA